MPNSLNTRLLRVTNEEENGQVITQIRPREYDYSISYVDNFGGFVPYYDASNTSDVRISYDLLDSVSLKRLKCLESLKEFQQFCWNVCFKYNKKSKVFYNKI